MVEGHFRAGGIDRPGGRKQMEGNEALGVLGEPRGTIGLGGWSTWPCSTESRFHDRLPEMVTNGGYTAEVTGP